MIIKLESGFAHKQMPGFIVHQHVMRIESRTQDASDTIPQRMQLFYSRRNQMTIQVFQKLGVFRGIFAVHRWVVFFDVSSAYIYLQRARADTNQPDACKKDSVSKRDPGVDKLRIVTAFIYFLNFFEDKDILSRADSGVAEYLLPFINLQARHRYALPGQCFVCFPLVLNDNGGSMRIEYCVCFPPYIIRNIVFIEIVIYLIHEINQNNRHSFRNFKFLPQTLGIGYARRGNAALSQ